MSHVPLGHVNLDEAIDEAEDDAHLDDVAPMPPMPFGTFDVERALEESRGQRAGSRRPPATPPEDRA